MIKVKFKDIYMPHGVIRECENMTEEQIIEMYELDSPDVEYYYFLYETV